MTSTFAWSLAVALAGCAPVALVADDPTPVPAQVAAIATCARSTPFAEAALRQDLAYLASPQLDGRAPGSAGDVAARAFVAQRFACLGISGVGAQGDYGQAFTDDDGHKTGNVMAILPGGDPAVGSDVIVLSAHLDHFGQGKLGANDDASGVAAVLAAAAALKNHGTAPRRTVVFALFGAEESGFEGSAYFVAHPPAGIDPARIVYAVNLDMVGSYAAAETVEALGTFAGTPGRTVVAAHTPAGLDVTLGNDSDQSDHATFCSRGVPYVFLWTEDEACYHKACDTADRLDYAGLAQIAQLTAAVVWDLANTATDLAAGVHPGQNVCAGNGSKRRR